MVGMKYAYVAKSATLELEKYRDPWTRGDCERRLAPFLYLIALVAAVASQEVAAGLAAPGPCDRHATVIDLLSERYGEAPVALGVTGNGSLVEVLVDAARGTWTIIVTSPEGLSCLVLSGEGWRHLEQIARDPEA